MPEDFGSHWFAAPPHPCIWDGHIDWSSENQRERHESLKQVMVSNRQSLNFDFKKVKKIWQEQLLSPRQIRGA